MAASIAIRNGNVTVRLARERGEDGPTSRVETVSSAPAFPQVDTVWRAWPNARDPRLFRGVAHKWLQHRLTLKVAGRAGGVSTR
jgi:hypothetical protein